MAITAVLLDIDGTLTERGRPVPGAASTLAWLRRRGIAVRLLTNIDSRTPATVHRELADLGIEVEPPMVFTPAAAARRFLEAQPSSRCHLLMSADLRAFFAAHDAGEAEAAFVLVGDCREVGGYAALNAAFRRLRQGAQLLALQRGRFFLAPDGASLDTGAFVALLEYASGQTARAFGKPSADFFAMALDDLGRTPGDTLVAGDDVTTDVAGALAVGARAVLVRTGKFAAGPEAAVTALAAAGGSVPVIDSIADLPGLIESLGEAGPGG
ncbi:MAG: HAD hydrolase-like protein [Candidatus Dormibacteria bacterium]|jgi:HAD superfamily hydrolase (TIGR01458 family)